MNKTNRRGYPIKRNPNVHPEFYDYFTNDELSWQEHDHQTTQAVYDYGVMGFLGAGIGQSAKEAGVKWDVDTVIHRIGDQKMVLMWVDHDFEDNSYRKNSENATTRELCERLTIDTRWYKPGELSAYINKLADLHSMLADMYDSDSRLIFFGTEKEYDKKEAEERRLKLEKVAKRYAAKCGAKIGTFDFIHKVEEEISRVSDDPRDFNGGEQRAERYAACMYAGCRDSFWEDNDFENGRYSSRIDDLEGIIDWLRGECPLLMAQYEEMKLKGEWSLAEVE